MPTHKRWQIVIGLAVIALAFQLFLRYAYVSNGSDVTRVDRLTGTSCVMPCDASSVSQGSAVANATYTALVQQISNEIDDRAINIAKQTPQAALLQPQQADPDVPPVVIPFQWAVDRSSEPTPPPAPNDSSEDATQYALQSPGFQTRVVCATAPSGKEWCWEVHVDSGNAIYVNSNPYLMQKYGFSAN